jgi:integration host factor subunit alpha
MTHMADGEADNGKDDAGTLTRADLCESIHQAVGLSRSESSKMVERVLHHMCEALERGENVKISGFGSFVLRDKGERIGRNPKTGVEVPIAPRRVLTFRASHMMRDRIVKAGG